MTQTPGDFSRVWEVLTPANPGAAAACPRGEGDGGRTERAGGGDLVNSPLTRRRTRLRQGRPLRGCSISASTSEEKRPPSERRVLVGALSRKHQKRVTFRETPPPAPVRRPAHVARMLTLAHHLQSAIDRGLVPARATVARRLRLSRARVTQLLDLLLLAPDLQDQVLRLEVVDGVEPLS